MPKPATASAALVTPLAPTLARTLVDTTMPAIMPRPNGVYASPVFSGE